MHLLSQRRSIPQQKKGVIAVDDTTSNAHALLLQQTVLCIMLVRAYLPRSINSLAGVMRGADKELSMEDMTIMLSPEQEVSRVRRLGESTTICIVSLPTPKWDTSAIQCGRTRIGRFNVRNAINLATLPLNCCTYGKRCNKYAGPRGTAKCAPDPPRCINCRKPHEVTSPACS